MILPMDVVIFSKGAGNQQYGLGQDAKLLEIILREMNTSGKTKLNIKHKDPYMWVGQGKMPTLSDIHIYLEVPCRSAYPWAKINIVIPNQEWWYKNEWSWVFDEPSTYFFYRTRYIETKFNSLVKNNSGSFISWRCPVMSDIEVLPMNKKKRQILFMVGGSVNKIACAKDLVNFWQPTYPPLIIVSSTDISGCIFNPDNVTIKLGHISESEKKQLQNESLYHMTASIAEGFGYVMAEAINYGSIPIWTDIPVYTELWGDLLGNLGRITTFEDLNHSMNLEMNDIPRKFTVDSLHTCMDNLLSADLEQVMNNYTSRLKQASILLNKNFRTEFQNSWKQVEKLVASAPSPIVPPKMIPPTELPTVGIVTLVYNRPEWFAHAVRNIQTCDYPRDKIVWVIVDDSDGLGRVDFNVEKIKSSMPDLKVQYVSSGKKLSIGEKRNRGCAAAIVANSATSMFAFMDDDDHYPKASLIMRVLWLNTSKKGCVYCSTLPMYDIQKYISAINVPPLNLSPCKRVSEASMCFTKTFFDERKFPNDVNVAEGELFIKDRELDTMEIPPEGIIVSFLHGKNSTSRRVPEQKEANGCHFGFSDEYFTMISKIASSGVKS